MKRLIVIWVLLVSTLTIHIAPTQAADNCGVGSQLPATFDYMNAPADPTSVAAFAGTKKLGELRVNNSTAIANFSVSPFTVDGLLPGEIETYFFYWSSDGGKNWNCTRAYAGSTSVSIDANRDYVAVVVAQARTGKGISTVAKFSTKRGVKQICATGKISLQAIYDSSIKQFNLQLTLNNLTSEEKSLQYLLEVSTDNWKTKAVYKDLLSLFLPYRNVKPLKDGSVHQFRLSPDASKVYVDPNGLITSYTAAGCTPLVATAAMADNRTECEKNPGLEKCQFTVVPGENSEPTPAVIPSPAPLATSTVKPAPLQTRITITCVKGKLTRKVIGIKPTCPNGYKLKK
jgi:hypothetical protein